MMENEQGADDAEVRGWEPRLKTQSLLGYKGQGVCEVKEDYQALSLSNWEDNGIIKTKDHVWEIILD